MSAQSFNWDDLRFFLAVARYGTLSLAGRRMGVDHATVSRRIASLEESLGLQLFERNPRGYNLTQNGEQLFTVASTIETEAIKIEESPNRRKSGITGAVRISLPEGFGNFFLAPRLVHFALAHPKLRIEMITIQQIIALSRREADVAVVLNLPAGDNYAQEHLTNYHLSVYGAREYLKSAPQIRSREDLVDHPFIGYVDDLIFTKALSYLSEVHIKINSRLQNSSLQAQLSATISGAGLCVLPNYIAHGFPELVPVLSEEVSLQRSYWMISDNEFSQTAQVRLTKRFLRDLVDEHKGFFL